VGHRWMTELARLQPELEIRENEPYDGRSEGLTTTLRNHFPRGGALKYAGLEPEVNQGLLGRDDRFSDTLAAALVGSLARALDAAPGGAAGG
jgi:predicted N-formylglutamate amidohydrolase